MGCLGEWPKFVPTCFSEVTGGETLRLETNVWVLWGEIKAEKQDERKAGVGVVSDKHRADSFYSKKWTGPLSEACKRIDEKSRVLQATLVQAFLPHFTFIISPEITCKPSFVALNVYLQYSAYLLGKIWHDVWISMFHFMAGFDA